MTNQHDEPSRAFLENILWSSLAAIVTALLLVVRDAASDAHVALAYLLVILGASARRGRVLGFVLALVCFVAFNFFFVRPYYTLAVQNPLDWLVLLAFLSTTAVATQLLHRARSEARSATQRAQEVDRLAMLGAETLNAPHAEDAAQAIADVIRERLQIDGCEIYASDSAAQPMRRIARSFDEALHPGETSVADHLLGRASAGLLIAIRTDGTDYVVDASGRLAPGEQLHGNVRTLLIPLRAGARMVGVMRVESMSGRAMEPAHQRFAEALSYYAALALERARLTLAEQQTVALREADRLKDELLAAVSHDLRTPLTTIKALAHDVAAEGDERAFLIEEEADRLSRYVTDLLELSRLNAGHPSIQPDLIAAEDVLGAALQQVQGASVFRIIRASVASDEPILVGRFDFVPILRALVNLIENALKYSPEAAPVDVTLQREGAWLVFNVDDRGPGISQSDSELIYTPFYRGSAGRTSSGTGLGLPIARRAVELQAGTLSHAPRSGGGTTFSIRLPAADLSDLIEMS